MTVLDLIKRLQEFNPKSQIVPKSLIVDNDGDDELWDIELFIGGEDPEGTDYVVMRTNHR